MKTHLLRLKRFCSQQWSLLRLDASSVRKINLCCGPQKIPGYLGIDVAGQPDLRLNLENHNLPFQDASLEVVACTSAINYFSRARGREIIDETYRVLKVGGIARFSVQDLESIARRYVEKDTEFFFQTLGDGRERFEGPTLGDKFAAWFYGYASSGRPCRYFYDYESLAYMFDAGGGFRLLKKEIICKAALNIST